MELAAEHGIGCPEHSRLSAWAVMEPSVEGDELSPLEERRGHAITGIPVVESRLSRGVGERWKHVLLVRISISNTSDRS